MASRNLTVKIKVDMAKLRRTLAFGIARLQIIEQERLRQDAITALWMATDIFMEMEFTAGRCP